MLSTGGDFLLYAFVEILNPIRSADNIFRACSAVKFRDGLRISAETRVEASKPRAVRMSTCRPTEAEPKPSANDNQLLKYQRRSCLAPALNNRRNRLTSIVSLRSKFVRSEIVRGYQDKVNHKSRE